MNKQVKYWDIYKVWDHVFLCWDLELWHFQFLESFFQKMEVEFVYSDPPRNKWNAKYWRTHAEKKSNGTVKSREVNFYWSFIPSFFKYVTENSNRLFMEVSEHWKWTDNILSIAEDFWLQKQKERVVYYWAPTTINSYKCCWNPNKIICFSEKGWAPNDLNPSWMKWELMTDHVFSKIHKKWKTVIDFCVWKWMTARMAEKYWMKCVWMELNPYRLGITIDWFEVKCCKPAVFIKNIFETND